jgi:NAD(P)-dependent dehydrogenase (short-subunit alcohol dehydrogenase family)
MIQSTPGDGGALASRVALVTGGGWGLGRVIAQALAAADAAVAVAARTDRELTETVATINATGGRATVVPVDVTDSAAVEEAVAEIERRLGLLKVRRLEITDRIPKSATGKILRRVLVERERAAVAVPA